jgi:hypothetical protein
MLYGILKNAVTISIVGMTRSIAYGFKIGFVPSEQAHCSLRIGRRNTSVTGVLGDMTEDQWLITLVHGTSLGRVQNKVSDKFHQRDTTGNSNPPGTRQGDARPYGLWVTRCGDNPRSPSLAPHRTPRVLEASVC